MVPPLSGQQCQCSGSRMPQTSLDTALEVKNSQVHQRLLGCCTSCKHGMHVNHHIHRKNNMGIWIITCNSWETPALHHNSPRILSANIIFQAPSSRSTAITRLELGMDTKALRILGCIEFQNWLIPHRSWSWWDCLHKTHAQNQCK